MVLLPKLQFTGALLKRCRLYKYKTPYSPPSLFRGGPTIAFPTPLLFWKNKTRSSATPALKNEVEARYKARTIAGDGRRCGACISVAASEALLVTWKKVLCGGQQVADGTPAEIR